MPIGWNEVCPGFLFFHLVSVFIILARFLFFSFQEDCFYLSVSFPSCVDRFFMELNERLFQTLLDISMSPDRQLTSDHMKAIGLDPVGDRTFLMELVEHYGIDVVLMVDNPCCPKWSGQGVYFGFVENWSEKVCELMYRSVSCGSWKSVKQW